MMRRPKPHAVRVIIDAKCDATDVNMTVSAIRRLRGVKHADLVPDLDLDAPIAQLGLSTRPQNALVSAKITTFRELTARSRHEIKGLKNLGKKGLCEIEECLATLGTGLRPQTLGEIQESARLDRERMNEAIGKVVAEFNEVRPALRRLWTALGQKGYVTENWHDWQKIDMALRRYAREKAGIKWGQINDDISPYDKEPFADLKAKKP